MIDLNRARRRREIQIANEVVAELVKHGSPPLELIGQVLVAASERCGATLDVASGKRILKYVTKEIDRKQLAVDRLAAAVEGAT